MMRLGSWDPCNVFWKVIASQGWEQSCPIYDCVTLYPLVLGHYGWEAIVAEGICHALFIVESNQCNSLVVIQPE